MSRLPRIKSLFDVVRRRMIRETEVALLYGMCFPDRHPRIPSIQVGKGKFDRAYADQFWEEVLGTDTTQ
ncbi:MAG: hypothetical protein ACPGXK_03565 [Phycisphaerae bacterium]